jgi:hypothetical protein
VFPGSSAVEQPAVNRLVAGSNPARGASQIKHLAQISSAENSLGAPLGAPSLNAHLSTALFFQPPSPDGRSEFMRPLDNGAAVRHEAEEDWGRIDG